MKKILLALLIAFMPVTAQATNWCADSAIKGGWLMEGSTTEDDCSSNNEDLSVSAGDTIEQSSDKTFGSFSRDFELGDVDHLLHADGGSTDFGGANQAITIVAWIKLESEATDQAIVAKWTASGNNRAYSFRYDTSDDGIACAMSPDGVDGTQVATGVTNLTTGVWYHIACVYNDTDIRVYVNGDLDSNGSDNPFTYSGGIDTGSAIFTIGARDIGGTTIPFDGLIDEVAIFNDAKSEANIEDIMNNGLQGSASSRRIMMVTGD